MDGLNRHKILHISKVVLGKSIVVVQDLSSIDRMFIAVIRDGLGLCLNGGPQCIERIGVAIVLLGEHKLAVRGTNGRTLAAILIEPSKERVINARRNLIGYGDFIGVGVFHRINPELPILSESRRSTARPCCIGQHEVVAEHAFLLFPLGIKHVVAIRERVLITRLISFASALALCVPASEFVAGARKPVSSNRYLLLGFATRRLHSTFAAVGFIAQKVCVLGVVDVDYVLLILLDLEHISRFNLAKGVIFEFLIRIIGRINSGSSFKKIRLSLERFARILVDVIHRKIRKVGCIDRAVEMPRQSRRNIVISAALYMELRPFRFVDDQ